MKTLPLRIGVVPMRVQTVQAASWRPVGATSNARGYTYAWRQARLRFLQAHPLCVLCEAEGIVEAANVVDHKIPHRGNQDLFWDKSNWRSLCKPHHDSDAQKKDNALSVV